MNKQSIEDTWGMREYSLQNSVRIVNNNPDMKNNVSVSCACGELINQNTDWHVMIANGTKLCYFCANCNSCRKSNACAPQRLVCIDGLVLCHDCLVNFGYPRQPTFRIKFDDPNGLIDPANANHSANNAAPAAAAAPAASATASTTDVLQEYRRKDRSLFREKADGRRQLRRAYYERQMARLPDKRNPLVTAVPYDASKGSLEKMVCPVCSKAATGTVRYVVAAIGRIYHRSCFACQNCKIPMNQGIQVAGRHFELCSCEPPQAWCTRSECKLQRMAHHESSNCWLAPIRPGGREQRDTDISAKFDSKDSKNETKADQKEAGAAGAQA
ncbi:hypothetical protein BOX15_Mlig031545g5 [Macrostomum lignano]|uniref:LIM zinc-binding domain-containing protein n=1 Tax=Macrostomum lignano TaxID=282301 RepID=A0A267DK33_9PLAT|nr:hypothetical protein BOX15_Mlig031545g3 [Macrostomum lignano]PAA76626.1 hypothetical protein BOX15_Mlig031545g5 [Macrostomum lignano]